MGRRRPHCHALLGAHTIISSATCQLPAEMPRVHLNKGSIHKTRQFEDTGSAGMHTVQHGTMHCDDVVGSWDQSSRVRGGSLSQHKNKPQAGTVSIQTHHNSLFHFFSQSHKWSQQLGSKVVTAAVSHPSRVEWDPALPAVPLGIDEKHLLISLLPALL